MKEENVTNKEVIADIYDKLNSNNHSIKLVWRTVQILTVVVSAACTVLILHIL